MYNWSTSPVQTAATATGLCGSTTYTICATDGNGCSSCAAVAIPFTNPTGIFSSANEQSISIFPNPTTGEFTVYGLVAINNLNIYDVFGNLVFQTTTSHKQEIVNTHLPAGIYFMEINSQNSNKKLKFVIQ